MKTAMSLLLPTLTIVFAAAGGTPSQHFFDFFNYPDGTNVPGWTERFGNWRMQGGMLHSEPGGALNQVITRDGFSDTTNVVEGHVVHTDRNALSWAGIVTRYAGNNPDYFMVSLADQTPPFDGFDTAFMRFHRGRFSAWNFYLETSLSPPVTSARLRIQFVPGRFVMEIDYDDDGVWDASHAGSCRSCTPIWPKQGEAGLFARGHARFDEFNVFNAVLDGNRSRSIGQSETFIGLADPGALYIFGAAWSRGMIPIDSARAIPLAVDPLLAMALNNSVLFEDQIGFVDANGQLNPKVHIPNLTALVGLRPHFAVVTCRGTTFSEVSQDLQLTITR